MSSWKKIAALFFITAPLGILASACSLDTTDTTDTTESESPDGAATAPDLTPQAAIPPYHGGRQGCERRCAIRFSGCRYSRRPLRVCRRQLERCLDDCSDYPD